MDLTERVLSVEQRKKRAREFKRILPRVIRQRKLRMQYLASEQQLNKRAERIAKQMFRVKFAGTLGAEYHRISPTQKIEVDKLIDSKQKQIRQLAIRLIPIVRMAELKRYQHYKDSHGAPAGIRQHNEDIEHLDERRLSRREALRRHAQYYRTKHKRQLGKYIRKHRFGSEKTVGQAGYRKAVAAAIKQVNPGNLERFTVRQMIGPVKGKSWTRRSKGRSQKASGPDSVTSSDTKIGGGRGGKQWLVTEDLRRKRHKDPNAERTGAPIPVKTLRETLGNKLPPPPRDRYHNPAEILRAAREEGRSNPLADVQKQQVHDAIYKKARSLGLFPHRPGLKQSRNEHNEEYLLEKNVPVDRSLWARAKSLAKKKFKIYPSAYANGWAVKWYKKNGGKWKTLTEDNEYEMARSELRTAMRGIERLMKHINGEGELEAWVQSKLTKAADYIDTLADYMDSRDETVKEAYHLIDEAKKKLNRSIPPTIQNMTPGSNPYADDSNCPSYVTTPGQAITEASARMKREYKGLMRKKGPGVAKQREALRAEAAARAKAAAVKAAAARAARAAAKAKPTVPPVEAEKTNANPQNTQPKHDTFQGYLENLGDTKIDYKKAAGLIAGEHRRELARALGERHPAIRLFIINNANKQREDSLRLLRDVAGGPVHKILKALRLREETSNGDINRYIEKTPGQLPLEEPAKNEKNKKTAVIKQVVAEQVLTEVMLSTSAGRKSHGGNPRRVRRGSPAGRLRRLPPPKRGSKVRHVGPTKIRAVAKQPVSGALKRAAKYKNLAGSRTRQAAREQQQRASARYVRPI